MSINMADVKEIINNANNKEVVKIQDSLGNILWQKQVTPTITYNVLMFTVRMTLSTRAGYLDVNMFNGNQGAAVDSVTSIDQYFCLLTQSEFEGFNNKTLATGTTIGTMFNNSTVPGTPYRLCYYENDTMHIVGGGTTITNDTPVGHSDTWSTTDAQFYPATRGTITTTSSEMFRVVYNNTVNLRINMYKMPVYHTQTDATGYTIGNRRSIQYIG